jgi:hypothetical protein
MFMLVYLHDFIEPFLIRTFKRPYNDINNIVGGSRIAVCDVDHNCHESGLEQAQRSQLLRVNSVFGVGRAHGRAVRDATQLQDAQSGQSERAHRFH